ncbi:MAG: NAD-dependent epimerase/dehydratase family protein [Cyanobium sp. MAG06]|nr:NAD-dependent epimerase/dehydratase family protein [Cyanobium sp. MAG06]
MTGSENVFNFTFKNNIDKLIYFSTVASYGAEPDNEMDYMFTENDEFRKSGYLYAEEKRIAEERLKDLYNIHNYNGTVIILRPAAISGPRGRYGRIRFGLQSALSGSLKKEKSLIYNIIAMMTAFVPVTSK